LTLLMLKVAIRTAVCAHLIAGLWDLDHALRSQFD
jgi:hypothetical protein